MQCGWNRLKEALADATLKVRVKLEKKKQTQM